MQFVIQVKKTRSAQPRLKVVKEGEQYELYMAVDQFDGPVNGIVKEVVADYENTDPSRVYIVDGKDKPWKKVVIK